MSSQIFVTALAPRAQLLVHGPDAVDFLQNLLTQNLSHCDDKGWRNAALLTPQGKVVCAFLMRRTAPDTIVLDVDARQAGPLAKRFGMYRLRAAVEIEVTPRAVAIIWSSGGATLPDAAGFLPDLRHAALGLRGDIDDAPPGLARADVNMWQAHRHALGVAEGPDEIPENDAFPLEYGLHLTGAVDFQKGCFVGQEVTSRTHRKGSLRKTLRPISATATLPPIATPVMAGARQAGEIRAAQGHAGLALLRVDMADAALTAEGVEISPGTGLF